MAIQEERIFTIVSDETKWVVKIGSSQGEIFIDLHWGNKMIPTHSFSLSTDEAMILHQHIGQEIQRLQGEIEDDDA